MRSETEYGPIFEGRYSDGTSAAARDVQVRLISRGVEISWPGLEQALVWPYGALHAADPLNAHSIDALLTYGHMPGATLFVPEGTFARRLAVEAPQLTAKSQRLRNAAPWIWAAASAVLVSVLVWAAGLQPSRAIAGLLPDSARETLGQKVVASMSDGRKTCSAADGQAALDELAKRLAAVSGSSRPFKIVIIDWSLMNAFAAPGEQIVLTRGILEKAESPDEVASVLAHEMGHGLELHPETGIVRAIGMSAAIDLMLGGSGGALANMGALLAQLSYGRDAEREADGHALRMLKAAGISPKGFADFFKRVQQEEENMPGGKTIAKIDILRTHPLTDERRRTVESQPSYPATPALSQKSWLALKGICKGLTKDADEPGKAI